ncbi:MAG: hypothetical protein IM638_11400 [Bacteroidetes bacterium]|nr:hypothetical protein [Bacteroidota bacterium]
MSHKRIQLVILLLIIPFIGNAASKTWTGTGGTSWTTASSWNPSGVPTSSDTVFFNSGSINCSLPATTVSIQRMYLQGTYTGTITMGTGALNLTNATRTFTQSSGTFTGSGATLTISGPFVQTGGTFTAPTGVLAALSMNFGSSGSFNNNNGIVRITGTSTLTVATSRTVNFHQLIISPTALATVVTIASNGTFNVNNLFRISGSRSVQINKQAVGNGILNLKGNMSVPNTQTSTAGTATLIFNASSGVKQYFTGNNTEYACRLPLIQVAKTTTDSLVLDSILTIAGGLTHISGQIAYRPLSMICFVNTQTISWNNQPLNHVKFNGGSTYTLATGSTLRIMGKLSFIASTAWNLNQGTLECFGSIDMVSTFVNSVAANATSIVVKGGGVRELKGSGTAGGGRFPAITIDADSLAGDTLKLTSVISLGGNFNYSKGRVVSNPANPGSFACYANMNYDAESSTGQVISIHNFSVSSGTVTLGGNMRIINNISISSGTTLNANTRNINFGGNWTNNNGTFTPSTGTVTVEGADDRAIRKTNGGTLLTETFSNLSFNRTSGKIRLKSPVAITGVMTLTKGRVIAQTNTHLSFVAGSSYTGGGNGAYVAGPVRKTGNTAFVFPLGDSTLVDSVAWHPLGISAPAATGDVFEAIYSAAAPPAGTMADDLGSLSATGNWTLTRIGAGTSSLRVTLYWNANVSSIDWENAQVAYRNGSSWSSLGQQSYTATWPVGSVTASSLQAVSTTPVQFAIAVKNSAGFASLERKLSDSYYNSRGVFYFKFEDEYDFNNGSTNKHVLSYKLLNAQNQDMAPAIRSYMASNNLKSEFGDNRFMINLATSSGALAAGYYVLEVTDEKGQKWFLRIRIS